MAKEFSRTDRVAELIQRELARIIQFGMKDPRVSLVTVSAVKVSRDLSYAKVYVSCLGDQEEIQAMVDCLNHARAFLRVQLAKTIQLRVTPELRFVQDFSITEGGRLSRLIDDVTNKPEQSDGGDEESGS